MLPLPEGQEAVRVCKPSPQSVLQGPQAVTSQAQPVMSRQASAPAGAASAQCATSPEGQVTCRVRTPRPQPEPQAPQAPTDQAQGASQSRVRMGSPPLQLPGSGQLTSRFWCPGPQAELHADHVPRTQLHCSPTHGSAEAGLAPAQSASRGPEQRTSRVRSPAPQVLEHSDQRLACHAHVALLWHASEASGAAKCAQSCAAPEEHETFRERIPSPQDVEQAPHAPAAHAQPAVPWQASASRGRCRWRQSASPPPLLHVAFRVRRPVPQALLQAPQSEVCQAQPLKPMHGASRDGGGSAQSAAEAPEQETFRVITPAPQSELHALQASACHAQPAVS